MIASIKIGTKECPKYLEVKFDRILTYGQHLESVKNKLRTRKNIIAKLAGTSVLKNSALALVYSVTE
jgi:hypothetical protein